MKGMRVAVAGMGSSGRAAAKLLARIGAEPVVFDQKPGDDPDVLKATDLLAGLGIEARPGWHGHLDPNEFETLVVSPGFPLRHMAIEDMLDANREVLSEVELAYRHSKRPILAITGTNGKSTTTVLAWLLLNAAGQNAMLCGNIAASGYPERPLAEAALATLGDEPPDWLVAEISSFQLEWVSQFRPKIAAILNVTPDHGDRHATFQEYFETKTRLLARLDEGDTWVATLAEASVTPDQLIEFVPGRPRLVTFDPMGRAPFEELSGRTRRRGDQIRLGERWLSREEYPPEGEASLSNLFCAWEMASVALGAPSEDQEEAMREAARHFRGLTHRMELVGKKNGIRVINNSMCTNPASVIANSLDLAGPQILLMGGKRKELDYSVVGDFLREKGHTTLVFGPSAAAFSAALGIEAELFASLPEAFARATELAQPGSAILLSPGAASETPYADFRQRGAAFVAMAREWLDS